MNDSIVDKDTVFVIIFFHRLNHRPGACSDKKAGHSLI